MLVLEAFFAFVNCIVNKNKINRYNTKKNKEASVSFYKNKIALFIYIYIYIYIYMHYRSVDYVC